MSVGALCNIYFLDWKNKSADDRYEHLLSRFSNVYRVELEDNLIDSIQSIGKYSNHEYFWIVSSLTDYSKFDFTQYNDSQCDLYTHVFGANTWLTSKSLLEKSMDVPHIEALPNLHFVQTDLKQDQSPLDIVYISNGEPLAEKHYQDLIKTVKTSNKIHRIAGINGRTQAYQAAANISETAWFFAVFAKIEVNPDFNWTWMPDAIKGPKHYIFHALNPVNSLEYGHMAVVAYNKHLTLSTNQVGLDFIMTKPHDVVPLLSGTAHYNQDAITTWRTAFREVLKLRYSMKTQYRQEDILRMEKWSTGKEGKFGDWSIRGCDDANEYFDLVQGNYEMIKRSYEWNWLDEYFKRKYSL